MAIFSVSLQIFRFFFFFFFFYRNVSWVVLYDSYEFCPNRWIWLVAMVNFWKKYSKIFSSKAVRGMKLKLCIHVHDISLYINCVFIVVAHVFVVMATLSFHRLIMGKVEIGIYFCVTADILKKVLQKCYWSSPLLTIWILFKSLILIGDHGNQKAKFSKKIFKNLLLRSRKGDEAETLHKCSWH